MASLKSADLKLSSPNSVLKVIVNELEDLWANGINFNNNGEEISIKVALAQVCGDNLGLHCILGFSEGFNANWPCRRCKMHRTACQVSCSEDKSLFRNVDNFELDLSRNCLSETGINFSSVLNSLPYYHVTSNFVFDIMHDLFKGVVPDLFYLVITRFINLGKFSIDKLNYRLESYDFGRHYNKSRPSQIKSSFLKSETKAGQNSSQNICLILFLPLLIGDLIDPNDKVWSLLLLLHEIVQMTLSNNITKGGIIYLNSIISEFLHNYQILFKKNLKPKHHHMIHYGNAIEQIGPLRGVWSMHFEARHKFFKTTAHAIGNFKNISKTLAYRFQLSRCFKLIGIDKFSPETFDYSAIEFVSLDSVPDCEVVKGHFLKDNCDTIGLMTKINKNGSDFHLGGFVLLKYCSQFPIFGRIKSILVEDDEFYFLVEQFNSKIDTHFASYELKQSGVLQIIHITDVAFYQCFYPSITFCNDTNMYIVLPVKFV